MQSRVFRLSFLLVNIILLLQAPSTLGLELTVLHVNDIHVRFEETNTYGGTCKENDVCFGGLARLLYKVNDIRSSKSEKNVIFLNGGDFYQGNIWYSHFKWRAVTHFGNILNFTAMALGNHEFDDRIPGLTPLLDNATFPIICSNIDVSEEERLQGKVPKSVVIQVENITVGIIGYVTKDTDSISRPGKLVRFMDEVDAINKEAIKLKSEGVDFLIALGHSGYIEDKRIAASVPDIDLVVGGHSHSFLYSTRNGADLPSREKPIGDYPTIVTQSTGKRVPVVQAFAYTKYLGYLKLNIDANNRVVSWNGSPILLDESVPQEQSLIQEMIPWKEEIKGYALEIIGETKILLIKSRVRETNLGNFITDAMIHHAQSKNHQDVYLAIMNSGGIRGSFEIGNITREDLLTVLPFENMFDTVSLRGRVLKAVFERSVERMTSDGTQSAGGFLQVSGFRLEYHLWNPPGKRLASIQVKDGFKSNNYKPLDPAKIYKVIVPSYLSNGGDGYTLIEKNNEGIIPGVAPDHMVLGQYIAFMSPIRKETISDSRRRIAILTEASSYSASSAMNMNLFILGLILSMMTNIFL